MVNNEHIERHNEEVRRQALEALKPMVSLLVDEVKRLSDLVFGAEPEPQRPEKKVSGPRQRRQRKPTVASEQEILAVRDTVSSANGEALTVRQIKQATTKIGQTTVAAACRTLVERGVFEEAGRKRYRLGAAQAKALENGEAQPEAEA